LHDRPIPGVYTLTHQPGSAPRLPGTVARASQDWQLSMLKRGDGGGIRVAIAVLSACTTRRPARPRGMPGPAFGETARSPSRPVVVSRQASKLVRQVRTTAPSLLRSTILKTDWRRITRPHPRRGRRAFVSSHRKTWSPRPRTRRLSFAASAVGARPFGWKIDSGRGGRAKFLRSSQPRASPAKSVDAQPRVGRPSSGSKRLTARCEVATSVDSYKRIDHRLARRWLDAGNYASSSDLDKLRSVVKQHLVCAVL
jgi:hypothetical protein